MEDSLLNVHVPQVQAHIRNVPPRHADVPEHGVFTLDGDQGQSKAVLKNKVQRAISDMFFQILQHHRQRTTRGKHMEK